MSRTPQLPFVNNEVGLGTPLYPSLPPNLAFIHGNIFHVRPYGGSDVNADGKSPARAFKTLANALAHCVSGQNDVVFFHSEGNSMYRCTDFIGSTLAWNKDAVHLIGVNSGVSSSPRCRISRASTVTPTNGDPMFNLTGNGCLIRGMQFWGGDNAHGGASKLAGVRVSGRLNRFENCHLNGFGDASYDVDGNYSLNLVGAIQNEFVDCVIGTYTVGQGAATGGNSEILYTAVGAGTSSHGNLFRRCRVWMHATHATYHIFIIIPTIGIAGGGIETYEDCKFINSGTSLSSYAFTMATDAGGIVDMSKGNTIIGAAHTIASASSSILYGPQATAYAAATALLSAVLGG